MTDTDTRAFFNEPGTPRLPLVREYSRDAWDYAHVEDGGLSQGSPRVRIRVRIAPLLASLLYATASYAGVGPVLIAVGNISGATGDMAAETAGPLENGVPGNRLGGVGSGLAHAGGNTFLAVADRGPNANPYDPCVDDTTSDSSMWRSTGSRRKSRCLAKSRRSSTTALSESMRVTMS